MNVNKLLITGSIIVAGALSAAACAGVTHDATKSPVKNASSPVSARPVTEPRVTMPTTAPKPSLLDAATLKKINYASAIPPATSVESLLKPSFDEVVSVRAQQNDLTGYSARALCGRTNVGSAAGGVLRQYLSAKSDVSVTYTVEGFTGNGAQDVMAKMKDAVNNCTMFQDSGSVWVRQPSIGNVSSLKGFGDDALALTTEDGSTHVMIADAFVRRGQFVYQIRVVSDSSTPYSIVPSMMWDFMHRAFPGFVLPSSAS